MQLPIIISYLANNQVFTIRRCFRVTADASCINHMAFRQIVFNTDALGNVPICIEAGNYIIYFLPQSSKQCLPHDAHYGSILQGSAAFDRLG